MFSSWILIFLESKPVPAGTPTFPGVTLPFLHSISSIVCHTHLLPPQPPPGQTLTLQQQDPEHCGHQRPARLIHISITFNNKHLFKRLHNGRALHRCLCGSLGPSSRLQNSCHNVNHHNLPEHPYSSLSADSFRVPVMPLGCISE